MVIINACLESVIISYYTVYFNEIAIIEPVHMTICLGHLLPFDVSKNKAAG